MINQPQEVPAVSFMDLVEEWVLNLAMLVSFLIVMSVGVAALVVGVLHVL